MTTFTLSNDLLKLLKDNGIGVEFAHKMLSIEEMKQSEIDDIEYMQDRIDCWIENL